MDKHPADSRPGRGWGSLPPLLRPCRAARVGLRDPLPVGAFGSASLPTGYCPWPLSGRAHPQRMGTGSQFSVHHSVVVDGPRERTLFIAQPASLTSKEDTGDEKGEV